MARLEFAYGDDVIIVVEEMLFPMCDGNVFECNVIPVILQGDQEDEWLVWRLPGMKGGVAVEKRGVTENGKRRMRKARRIIDGPPFIHVIW